MSAAALRPQPSSKRTREVLIVGAGFGGIAAAIELRRHGIEDVTVLEKAPDLGGTWFYNSYPGAACDVRARALPEQPITASCPSQTGRRLRTPRSGEGGRPCTTT